MTTTKLFVTVKTGASHNAVLHRVENELSVQLKARREKGKANRELLRFLKKQLGINARILRGHTSKHKVLCVY